VAQPTRSSVACLARRSLRGKPFAVCYAALADRKDVTMCVVTMGLMLALAPAAIFFGLMIWKDGIGGTPPETDARRPRRTISLHQTASNSQ
jgi:hypothetical protein